MNKIGRNSPCPCGSGKKYKQCCINKGESDFDNINIQTLFKDIEKRTIEKESVDTVVFFSQFNNSELLKFFALLQVLPENHGKNIRLEEIMKQAIKSNRGSNENVNIEALKVFILANFSYNHLEDPPENLFTENIMTCAGNMIVFPGLTEGQIYFLQQFLNIISRQEIAISSKFKNEALNSVLLLLAISDFIARSLNYNRNILAEYGESNDIYFPPTDFIQKKKDYFAITKKELNLIAKSINVDSESIEDFLLDLNNEDFLIADTNSNPIILTPILKTDQEYIIISPTTIVFACVSLVLKKAQNYNCLKSFILNYSKNCWLHSKFLLEEMGYYEVTFEFPETNLTIHEGIFVFDTNKIAYILFKYDDGLNYDPKKPFIPNVDEKQNEKLQDRRKLIYNQLKSDSRYQANICFHVNINLGIGRPNYYTFKPKDTKWDAIGLSVVDLVVLYKSDKCHNLTFWNYTQALKDRPLMTPFFLDNISYFIENDESLYPSDDKVDYLSICVGNALKFKSEAIRNHDEHFAAFPNEIGINLLPVIRETLPAQLPIYSTRKIPFLEFKVVTEILGKELWITTADEFTKPDSDKDKFNSEICISIAYWFSEMAIDLIDCLDFEKIKPLLIEIEINEVLNAYDVFERLDKNKRLEDEINIEINNNKISIKLNEYFYYYIFRNDNLGERILIKQILLSINSIFLKKNIYSGLDSTHIEAIINKHIPVGPKKKLLVQVADFDIRISPRNVKSIRELYRFEINKQIDNLGFLLSPKPYKPNNSLGRNEKRKLINSVVDHFYNSLRKQISSYKFEDMLGKLLMLYESSIQRREHYYFEATPKIECFKNHIDIYQKLSKENKKNIQHSLCLRCLIEHIIAEPPTGSKVFDVSGIDSSLAYMNNIINWGFISDELNFNITDIEVSLLQSGRIGTDKTFQTNVIEPFYKVKFSEDIHDLTGRFNKTFKLQSEGNLGKPDLEFDTAFGDEFKISYVDFSSILFESIFLAFEKDGSIYGIPKDDFLNEVSSKLNIKKETIKSLLHSFSLFNRGRVENVTNYGYTNIDFYPWRYNRALSILKKPFIITSIDEVEYIWFGSRALLDFKFNLISNIYSGRFPAKSVKLKSYLASINHKKGKEFNNEMFNFLFSKFNGHGVYREVGINPSSILRNNEDIGDLDILLIDENKKSIIAFECKNVNIARTPYEMHQEFMNFISGDNPWIPKVQKRDSWMKENIKALKSLHGPFNVENFIFEYVFLTNEAIPLPFIRENHIPYRFITSYDLEKNIECIHLKK